VVKGLVELHGGTVQAASAGPGKGAAFTVRLPLVPAPSELPIHPATASAETLSCRVLVIEDNLDVAESMKYLLEFDGHQVVVANTGRAGIEAARDFRPEVVLCDIGLPGGMDGFGVAKVLRNDAALDPVALIALTGYGQEEDRRRTREAGFDMHLIKPVDPVLLRQVLARVAERMSS
jgi:CheY-like chemotaxis protein